MQKKSIYCAQKVELLKNHNKSAILNFFSVIIELVRELLISSMHHKFEGDTWKTSSYRVHKVKLLT